MPLYWTEASIPELHGLPTRQQRLLFREHSRGFWRSGRFCLWVTGSATVSAIAGVTVHTVLKSPVATFFVMWPVLFLLGFVMFQVQSHWVAAHIRGATVEGE